MMTRSGNHIINRVVYHAHGMPVSKAFSIKEEAAAYIKGGFSNQLQLLFDKYFPGEDNIYIDKLQLDITLMPGEIDLSNYGSQLLELLEKQLQKKAVLNQPQKTIKKEEYDEQKLQGLIQNAGKENYTIADAFIFFLETGYLPWWCKITSKEEFEKQIVAYFEVANEMALRHIGRRIVNADSKIVYRFIHQFSDDFKFKLASIFIHERSAAIKKLHRQLVEAVKEKFTLLYKAQRKISGTKAQTYTQHSVETGTAFLFWSIFWHLVETNNSFEKFENEVKSIVQTITKTPTKPVTENKWLQMLIEENKQEQNPWFQKLIDKNREEKGSLEKNNATGPVTENLRFQKLTKENKEEKSSLENNNDTGPVTENAWIQKLTEENKEEKSSLENNKVTEAITSKSGNRATTDEIYINNAGLVLLHPFLTTLFNALFAAKDDNIINRAKAIASLNYLCGYKEMQPEFEWPLMKILCGMEISETVEQLFELSDADKLECNALLQQVIDYWIALKQTSAEGLQQTFIQRFGKLTANENGWLLQVEQKTVDILKDRLPWGVSMVKLPWMKQLLMVEW